jgi:GT2 family glycosyltransferase
MNAGAAVANGDVFLFLHADTWFQSGALDSLTRAMHDPKVVGGAFQRWFRSDYVFLTATCALAMFRNRAFGWHLGDQGIFCRADIFGQLGGFANMRAFEDVDFSRRMRRKGRLVTLRPAVLTSARRFEEGAAKRTAKDLVLTARYLLRPDSFRM